MRRCIGKSVSIYSFLEISRSVQRKLKNPKHCLILKSYKSELLGRIFDLKTTIERTEQDQIALNVDLQKAQKDATVAALSLETGISTQQLLEKAQLAQMQKKLLAKANIVKHVQLARIDLKPCESTE